MGKSYKKNPFYKAHMSGSKKMANGRIRVSKDIPNGGAYKKFFPSSNVVDYTFYWPWDEFVDYASTWCETAEEARRYWEKYYYRK